MKRILASALLGLSLMLPSTASATHARTLNLYAAFNGGGSACIGISVDQPNLTNNCGGWNNRASSVRIHLASDECVILWDGTNYSGPAFQMFHGPLSGQTMNLGSHINDKASSINFGNYFGGLCQQ